MKWLHRMQMQYMDGLLDWLAQENADSQSALHGMVDMDRIATAGHSRGAKLACLQFASNHHSLLGSCKFQYFTLHGTCLGSARHRCLQVVGAFSNACDYLALLSGCSAGNALQVGRQRSKLHIWWTQWTIPSMPHQAPSTPAQSKP